MREGSQAATNRREWLTGAIRYGALSGLVIVSGSLATRRSGRSCPGLSIPCQTCGRWSACELPRARAEREPRATKGQG